MRNFSLAASCAAVNAFGAQVCRHGSQTSRRLVVSVELRMSSGGAQGGRIPQSSRPWARGCGKLVEPLSRTKPQNNPKIGVIEVVAVRAPPVAPLPLIHSWPASAREQWT